MCLGLAGHGEGPLALLPDERLVDVRDDSAPGNGSLDQCVQLLISSDGELQRKNTVNLNFPVCSLFNEINMFFLVL